MNNKKKKSDLYGFLTAFGYNGPMHGEAQGRYRTSYEVRKRKEANGIKPHREIDLADENALKMLESETDTVVFSSGNDTGSLIAFKKDNKTDLFQIGRSTEPLIDYVVVDTIPGNKENLEQHLVQSTISRYAARFTVERSSPHRTRIYAAAFNSKRQIVLGEHAPQWSNGKKFSDGLTTNGVLLCHPKGNWGKEMKPGVWREVSVSGEMFGLRHCRSAKHRGKTSDCSNVLQDGTLIDLCGVVMLWRTCSGLKYSPSRSDLLEKREYLNSMKVQCPVGLATLRFDNKTNDKESLPYVYTTCGHVHGYHTWGARPGLDSIIQDNSNIFDDIRQCPYCKEKGVYVRLEVGLEPNFYIDNGPLTHAFVPCGHMTTELTARYWSRVLIPLGKDKFHMACPFCALPLEGEGFIKLIYQTQTEIKIPISV